MYVLDWNEIFALIQAGSCITTNASNDVGGGGISTGSQLPIRLGHKGCDL